MNKPDTVQYLVDSCGVLIERHTQQLSEDILCTTEIRHYGKLLGEFMQHIEWTEC